MAAATDDGRGAMRPRLRSKAFPIHDVAPRLQPRLVAEHESSPLDGACGVLGRCRHLRAVSSNEQHIVEIWDNDDPVKVKGTEEVGDEGLDKPRGLMLAERHPEQGIGAVAGCDPNGACEVRQ